MPITSDILYSLIDNFNKSFNKKRSVKFLLKSYDDISIILSDSIKEKYNKFGEKIKLDIIMDVESVENAINHKGFPGSYVTCMPDKKTIVYAFTANPKVDDYKNYDILELSKKYIDKHVLIYNE